MFRVSDDPDYEKIHVDRQTDRLTVIKKDAKSATIKKISSVLEKQISFEVESKEIELNKIQKTIQLAHQTLDQLRAAIVMKYYANETIQNVDRCDAFIHPTAKLYTGKSPYCYSAIDKDHDYTGNNNRPNSMATNKTKIDVLESDKSEKCEIKNEVALKNSLLAPLVKKEVAIIVGNISKYISQEEQHSQGNKDQTTHKWMIYVRLKNEKFEINRLVKKVMFFLHPSYKPNDLVEINDSPFYLCRRGWGEFPVRVQIHFKHHSNKPFDIIHNLRLDKTFTGLQTLGGETIVNVSLTVFENEFEEMETSQTEINKNNAPSKSVGISNFEFEVKPEKKIDSTEGEIEIKSDQNSINQTEKKSSLNQDDLISSKLAGDSKTSLPIKNADQVFKLVLMNPLNDPKSARYYLCSTGQGQSIKGVSILGTQPRASNAPFKTSKKDNIGSENAWKTKEREFKRLFTKDFINIIELDAYESFSELMIDLIKWFPIVSDEPIFAFCSISNEHFLNWNIGKQRWSEWHRAKIIHRYLEDIISKRKKRNDIKPIWWNTEISSAKKILLWTRQCGFVPPNYIRKVSHIQQAPISGMDTVSLPETLIKDLELLKSKLPEVKAIENDEIDVENDLSDNVNGKRKHENNGQHSTKCSYFEKPVEDIEIVQEVLIKVCQSFISEILHLSLQNGAVTLGGKVHPDVITIDDVFKTITSVSKFNLLTNKYLGTE